MEPKSLTIRNIGPYKNLEIKLAKASGPLIAVIGRNGMGKTFLLECMFASLYRMLPTRPAGIYRYCTDRNAALEFDFAVNGTEYRSVINLDSKTLKMTSVLIGPDGPINNGSNKTYDAEIEKLLGSSRMAMISTFAAQEKQGSFLTLSKAERKDLFLKMLGLEKLQGLSSGADELATDIHLLIEKEESTLSSLMAILQSLIVDKDAIHREMDQATATVNHLNAALESLNRERDEINKVCSTFDVSVDAYFRQKSLRMNDLARIGELDLQIAQDKALHDMRDALNTKLEVQNEMLRAKREEISAIILHYGAVSSEASKIPDIRAKIGTMRSRLEAQQSEQYTIEKDLRVAEHLAGMLTGLMEIKDLLESSLAERENLNVNLSKMKSEMTVLLRQSTAIQKQRHDLQSQLQDIKGSQNVEAAQLERAKADSEILASVPCMGQGEYSSCQFLVRSVEARDTIENLAASYDTAKAQILALTAQLDSMPRVEASSISSLERQIALSEKNLEALNANISKQKSLLDKMPAAEQAQSRIQALKPQLATILQTIDLIQVDIGSAKAELDVCTAKSSEARALSAEREVLKKECDDIAVEIQSLTLNIEAAAGASERMAIHKEQLQSFLEEAEARDKHLRELDEALEVIKRAKVKLSRVESAIADRKREIDDANALVAAANRRMAVAESQEKAYAEAKERKAVIEKRLVALRQEEAEYLEIKRIFGPMEIQSMEIENSGPDISRISNDLLMTCFGSRFSVKFATQVPKADGGGFKDAFDILVWDEENARAGTIDDLSPGQKVIINEAIRMGIALFNRSRNEVSWDVLFRDEASSALDEQNSVHYLSMLRAARDSGGFKKVYFVSHQGRVHEMADSKIIVADGSATISS